MEVELLELLEDMEESQTWSVRGFNNLKRWADGDALAYTLASLVSLPQRADRAADGSRALQYLGVARNGIGMDGATALASALAAAPSRLRYVTKVEAFCNKACSEWFRQFFSAALCGLPLLEVVDLGGMLDIGGSGDGYVSLMLSCVLKLNEGRENASRRRLREMHLDFLGLTDACGEDLLGLVHALELNCVFLEGNFLSALLLDQVVLACRRNRQFWNTERRETTPVCREVNLAPLSPVSLEDEKLELAEYIASTVLNGFFDRIPRGYCEHLRGQIVVAGFVRKRGNTLKVLSLATGTSFVSYEGCGFSYNELVVDSHAEVLARRALVHAVKCGAADIDMKTDSIYLYTSTAPCGYDKKSSGCTVLNKHLSPYGPPNISAQRRSCLAKINRWMNPEYGWGGKHFSAPMALRGVVVGRKFKSWCTQLGFLPSPRTGTLESRLAAEFGVVTAAVKGDSDTSWFWSEAGTEFLDGRVGRKLDGTCSTVSRGALRNIEKKAIIS